MLEHAKITEKDLEGKGVVGMPDVPGLSSLDMQKKFEEIPRDVIIVKFNELVNWLLENGVTKEDIQNVVVNAGAVTGVFGRRGEVRALKGDYTAEMVGAAAEKHSVQHRKDGSDPIDVEGIGAAPSEHMHGNITRDGRIGNTNGKVVVTGAGGTLVAVNSDESDFLIKPDIVGDSGNIVFTAENGKEYEYTEVTSLSMTGANVNCRGVIKFADTVNGISVSGFAAVRGDDIEKAAAGETWEFDVANGKIIWANWGVIDGT